MRRQAEHSAKDVDERFDGPVPDGIGVVVGVDGSNGSRHALRWALRRSDRLGPVQPVLTWRYPWWAYTLPIPPDPDHFHRKAEEVMSRSLDAVTPDNRLPPIVTRAKAGPTLTAIGGDTGMIVVGTRGHGALRDGLLGSVSSHVAAHATVPVVVVPTRASIDDRHRRVTVGIDGSENSTAALEWAIRHAPDGAVIDVVHCWVVPTAVLVELPNGVEEVYRSRARNTLDEAIRSVDPLAESHGRKIVACLEYGDPRELLDERAERSDLLVVGARGLGGVPHLLLGSATTDLLHQPRTATIVIPKTVG